MKLRGQMLECTDDGVSKNETFILCAKWYFSVSVAYPDLNHRFAVSVYDCSYIRRAHKGAEAGNAGVDYLVDHCSWDRLSQIRLQPLIKYCLPDGHEDGTASGDDG
jgi:hypothetical protein